jgi:hypothetical protein
MNNLTTCGCVRNKGRQALSPDTREWFAVVEGEVRVDIEGQTATSSTCR